MKEEYKPLLMKARSRKKDIERALSLLAKRKITDFDRKVHSIHDAVFSEIDCCECANCCRSLGPLLIPSDISRLASFAGMKPGAYADKYLKTDEDGDVVFAAMPCMFIMDNLCICYDVRPRACREYPHTDEKNMQSKLKRLSQNILYCPAAYLTAVRIIDHFKGN